MTVDDVCPNHFYNGLHRKAHWATSSQPTVSAKRSVLWSGDTAVFYWREEKNQKGGEQHYESSGDFVKKKKNKKKLKRNTEEFHSYTKMARFLGHGFNVARMNRSSFRSWQKWLSSDALAEIGVAPGEIGIVSGIPQEQLRRRVVIYSPSRTASQQGSGKVGKWKIDFLSTQKWENPLMGWTSTGDPYANVGDATLSFDSEEAAKLFCEKYGWEYVVKKRHTPLLKPKSYADNFKWKGPPKSDNN